MSASGALRTQVTCEEYQQRDRKQHGEQKERGRGLSKVQVVPVQARPLGHRALDGNQDLSQRDHIVTPSPPPLSASATRIGHSFMTYRRRTALAP